MPTPPSTIDPDDFESWRDNAITQAFFKHLERTKAAAHVAWVGMLSNEVPHDPKVIQLIQVELKAKLQFIDDVLGIELADLEESNETGSSEGS